MYQRNVKGLIFSKDAVNRSVTTQINETTTASATTGESWVLDLGNNVVDSTSTLPDKFRLAYKSNNGTIVFSDVVETSTIKNYRGKKSVAVAEQISYIGYDGSANSLEAISDNEYFVRLNMLSHLELECKQNQKIYGSYTSDSSATQSEVAGGLADNLTANFSKLPERFVKVERVCNDAGAATTGATGTLTTVYKSKYVSATVSAVAEFAVGSYVRFGTTTTSPIYKITAASGTTLTLDVAYQGTSGTFTAGNAEYITSALAAAANFGIKLTGVARTWKYSHPSVIFSWKKVKFVITLQNCGSTTITNSTVANEGEGQYQQVAELEAFTQGNEFSTPARDENGAFTDTYRTDYTFNTYYSQLSFDYSDNTTSQLGQEAKSLKQMVIAFGAATVTAATTGTTNTGANTSTITTLDAMVVAKAVGTAQAANL